MALPPVDLVLVRHGESEGNMAQAWSKKGDDRAWKIEDFANRHTSLYRLTDLGRTQAQAAGGWIKENIGEYFDKYYTSEYVRAMESAGHLNLPRARWETVFYLRERDNGVLANLSWTERQEQFARELERRERDSFYWAPPGGESIANTCLRVQVVLRKLEEQASGMRVIIVCHGNIMKAFRFCLEGQRQTDYHELEDDDDRMSSFHNGQIMWYTRRDPVSRAVSSKYKWVRSVCPWDLSLSNNSWQSINRSPVSNEDLLADVARVPQIVDKHILTTNPPVKTTETKSKEDDKAEKGTK